VISHTRERCAAPRISVIFFSNDHRCIGASSFGGPAGLVAPKFSVTVVPLALRPRLSPSVPLSRYPCVRASAILPVSHVLQVFDDVRKPASQHVPAVIQNVTVHYLGEPNSTSISASIFARELLQRQAVLASPPPHPVSRQRLPSSLPRASRLIALVHIPLPDSARRRQ